MKLGTQTASVTNHLLSRATIGQPEPTVGMGATILMWTDRRAATITAITETKRGRVLTVQYDKVKVISGSVQDGSAAYEYTPDSNGRIRHFRWENDSWIEVLLGIRAGTFKKIPGGGRGLRIGQRDEYCDPSF